MFVAGSRQRMGCTGTSASCDRGVVSELGAGRTCSFVTQPLDDSDLGAFFSLTQLTVSCEPGPLLPDRCGGLTPDTSS